MLSFFPVCMCVALFENTCLSVRFFLLYFSLFVSQYTDLLPTASTQYTRMHLSIHNTISNDRHAAHLYTDASYWILSYWIDHTHLIFIYNLDETLDDRSHMSIIPMIIVICFASIDSVAFISMMCLHEIGRFIFIFQWLRCIYTLITYKKQKKKQICLYVACSCDRTYVWVWMLLNFDLTNCMAMFTFAIDEYV